MDLAPVPGLVKLAGLLLVGLFLGMMVMLELGRQVRIRRRAHGTDQETFGLGVVDAGVFGLLGLLVAFTFSGAASRFDSRRHLVIEEANDIGTAYLRLDLLPADARSQLQQLFRQYLDARLATYQNVADMEATRAAVARVSDLQRQIWARAVQASRQVPTSDAAILLLPALNAMFDITTTRTAVTQIHPPTIIFALLVIVALLCSLLAGYGMAGTGGTRDWIHIIGFAFVLTVTVYVIVDLEYPRLGFIRVDAFDQLLVDLRATLQ
jgi:hypothetical protein